MKKSIIKGIIVFIVMIISIDAFAQFGRKEYFYKPQLGLWFGPISPVGETGELLLTNIGVGIFSRYSLPFYKPLKVAFDIQYHHFESKGVNELYLMPFFGNVVYLLPIKIPVKLQIKFGFGGSYVSIFPEKMDGVDPLFMVGAEVSFPAGRWINIGLRIDYLYIWEGYIKNEESNAGGHIVYAGLQLYFNINL